MSLRSDTRRTVLVTDAGRGSALAIIRSLGRQGYRVIAADCEKAVAGFRSRYVAERLIYPAPEEAPEACVQALRETAVARQVDLLIPVTDAVILPLSAAREQFPASCHLALPTAESLAVATNKEQTLALAERLGVPTPRTQLVHTVAEARVAGDSLGWPLVLKPQASRLYREHTGIDSFTVAYADGPERLSEQMSQFEGRCPVLLQEYCAGGGDGVELLLHEGKPLAAFQHHRLREVPITGGASAFRESVPLDPQLLAYSTRLLQELRWTGLAMVEFKSSANGPRLMEINGRVWGSLPLAVRSGMDFPRRLAELFLDGPPPAGAADTNYQLGVRARNLKLDLVWIANVLLGRTRYSFLPAPRRSQAIGALLELFQPWLKSDIFMLDDPLPSLSELSDVVQTFRGKLREAG